MVTTVTTENGSETTVAAKPWYASKVNWVNILSAILFFMESQEITNIVPQAYMDEFASVLGVVNVMLRFFTNGPVTMSAKTANEINRKLGVFLLCLVTLFSSAACAMRGKPVERQIAVYAIQVNDGLRAVGDTAKELHGAKLLTNMQYKAVLERLRLAFMQSSKLADALAAYDKIADTTTASQVKAALDALAVLVPNIMTDVGGGSGAEKIAELVANVNKLLLTIASGVAPSARMTPERELNLWMSLNEPVEAY